MSESKPPPRAARRRSLQEKPQRSIEAVQDVAPPHYLGHRERLRARFSETPDQIPDYELLELLLFRSIPRADVKGLAKTLIARFGSFAQTLAASPEHLAEVKGVGPAVVHDLKLIEASARRISQGAILGRQVLGSWASVLEYCHTVMAFAEIEELRVLFLDKKNGLIKDELMQRGTVDHTPVYPREIMRRAIQLNASALILVHNHPSGDPAPSRADIDMTREIVEHAEAVGLIIHDHLIIGKKAHASFRALGLL
ncbi:RadC DNA repair proteins [Rhabdaerophilaceae bacterium]